MILGLLLSGSALSDNHCNENRKDWIKQLNRDLAYDIEDGDRLCDLLREYKIGIKEKNEVNIDQSFFENI